MMILLDSAKLLKCEITPIIGLFCTLTHEVRLGSNGVQHLKVAKQFDHLNRLSTSRIVFPALNGINKHGQMAVIFNIHTVSGFEDTSDLLACFKR